MGSYGYGNLGDDLLLLTLLKALEKFRVSVLVRDKSRTPKPITNEKMKLVDSGFRRDNRDKILAFARAEIVIIGGGTLITDDVKTLLKILGLAFSSKLLGKKVALCAIGVGLLRNQLQRSLARLIVSSSSLVIARGTRSRDILNSLFRGTPTIPIILRPDPVFVLPGTYKHGSNGSKQKYASLCLRHSEEWTGGFPALMAQVCDRIIEKYGFDILLVPNSFSSEKTEWVSDLRASELVLMHMCFRGRATILTGHNPCEAVVALQRSSLVLGMTYHSLVIGQSSAIPTVAIQRNETDIKIRELMSDVKRLSYFFASPSEVTIETLLECIEQALFYEPPELTKMSSLMREDARLGLQNIHDFCEDSQP